jgi:hypothetical protein
MCRIRLPRKAAIALALLITVLAVPRLADSSGGAPAASASGAGVAAAGVSAASVSAASVSGASVSTGGAAAASASATAADLPASARTGHRAGPDLTDVRTVAAITPAAPGVSGPCSVPGIGDIGGLLGFCSLGQSGLIGDLNNICQPSLPDPEPADAGIDAMVSPPASGKQLSTLYDQYGVAGQNWNATNLQCSDMTSLVGNNVAGMVFDAAKSIDRVTITVYQAAAGEGILNWLQKVTDRLITSLGNAIYFPYLAVVVILGAIWLAWQGLIRKRGTRTIEGTIWMVVACAAAILLIGEPAAVTGLGRTVSDGMSQALDTAFANLPSPGPSSCVPLQKGDPQSTPTTYSYTSGGTVVDQNADELWTVLVCQPWLDGEFGTATYSAAAGHPSLVNTYGRSLLWAQAIAANEKPSAGLIAAKQAAYAGIASSLQTNDPGVYPLFQGKEWTTRLEIGFGALFAAAVAGLLILLISVTLILLKLGFLLLLIAGPFFLLVGTHPGFGRVLALRWLELLVGVLLKQAAVAVVLSVLLYCYALIMGTSNATLSWALKILMIALVTIAAFIYRKPFQHLFSAVGYGVIGSHDQAVFDLQRAGASARANTRAAATVAAPPFAAYRAGRWARRNPGQAAALAMAATSGGAAAVATGMTGVEAGLSPDGAPPTDMTAAANGAGGSDGAAGRATAGARARALASEHGPAVGTAPPLNLRPGAQSPAGPGPAMPAGTATPAPASSGSARPSWPGNPGRSAAQASAPPAAPAPAPPVSGRSGGGPWQGTSASPAGGLRGGSGSGSSGSGGSGSAPERAVPPRLAAPPRQPAPSRRQAPSRQQAPQPAPPSPPAPPRQASQVRQAPAAGQSQPRRPWLRRQGTPPPRQPARPASGGAPAPRSGEHEAGQSSQWLGKPINGPLAPPPPGQDPGSAADRNAPFWLRSRRRG